MLIPARIPIHGHYWSVKLAKGLRESDKCYGDCDYDTRTIRVDSSLPEWLMVDTLLHEIKHAYDLETGVFYSMTKKEREREAQTFASFTTSLFRLEFKEEWLMLGLIDTEAQDDSQSSD